MAIDAGVAVDKESDGRSSNPVPNPFRQPLTLGGLKQQIFPASMCL